MSAMSHTPYPVPEEFLFVTFFPLLSFLPLSPSVFFFSHSFLCLSGKARNVTELRPFWRPSLRSTFLNRYAASTLKAIHFTLNRVIDNQRTRNALFSRRLAVDVGCHVCLQHAYNWFRDTVVIFSPFDSNSLQRARITNNILNLLFSDYSIALSAFKAQ